MKVIIGNTEYNNVKWEATNSGDCVLTLYSGTIGEIATVCSTASEVDVYENEELIGKWFVIEFVSIEKGDEKIFVTFKASTLSKAKEQEIDENISNTEDVLLEVASLVAEISTAQEDAEEFLNQYKGRVENTIQSFDAASDQFNARVNEQNRTIEQTQSLLNQLQDALTAVQDAIAAMPQNVNERFHTIESTYNVLADRVAVLENLVGG